MIDKQWNQEMFELCELGQFLLSFNVIDIDFTNGEKIDVYLALTKEQRIRGLSNLSSLDVGGMLFCYDQPSYVPFSMAKMKMDLDIAWFDKNSSGKTHMVGKKLPNALGFYDMLGNVFEWCSDIYGAKYYKSCEDGVVDPVGASEGSDRVLRGGSWIYYFNGCRSSNRCYPGPVNRDNSLGLRVARTP